MLIPKYIVEIMSRSKITNDHYHYKKSLAGYTLIVKKSSAYTQINTFNSEIEKLIKWANKNYAESYILDIPKTTKHCNQYAIIVITDPVMQQLEKLLKERG